jgi:PAS domain S-box-containing protein
MQLKLSQKLTSLFFVSAVFVCALTSFIFYKTGQKQIMLDLHQRLHDIVSISTSSIDPRLHSLLKERSQERSSEYRQIKSVLQEIRDASSDIYYIYTMRQGPQGEIRFVVDAETNPDEIAHLGEVYSSPSNFLKTQFSDLNMPVVEQEMYTDKWGTWLSGYAPFYNQDGSRAGILGVDISADKVTLYQNHLLYLAAGIFILTLPIILIVGSIFGRSIAKPIVEIKNGAERIGQGDLDVWVNTDRRDEIGILAHSLNTMALKLKKSRDSLNEMYEKYRSIFDNSLEGIFQSTLDGQFITANKSMITMLGYNSVEDLTTSINDLKSQVYANPKDREVMVDILNQHHQIRNYQVRMKRKDGRTFETEMSARLITESQDTLIEGMVKDITERLEKEQAEKERQAAQSASKAKSEFLANMSHEIRTPLNAVMGMTDLLKRTDLTTKQQEYLKKIKISSQSLLAVINDILDFSKIEAGRLELEKVNFSLYEIMANVSEMFAQAAHDKEIELAVSIAEDIPMALVGDPVRLGQILINLTGNAIKFTDQGEVVVAVQKAHQNTKNASDQIRLQFSVQDTGPGIAKDRLQTIFESFSQADSSITRKHGGTGLGLAICNQLVNLMGGQIEVESALGQGSTFTFTAQFSKQPEKHQTRPVTPRDLRGLRILIVDDNKTSREILASAIKSFQMEAITVASGEEAVKEIQSQALPYDLILMDWKMPGISGVESARRIKQELNLNKLPIICMISAYGREDLLQQAEKNILDAFLHKPVNQSLLFDTIMGLFGRQSNFAAENGLVTASDSEVEKETPPERLAGARILLVEDNTINQEVAREWLESGKMEVTTAINGKIALDTLQDQSFDAVLMDIQMPEMDGLEATKRIRQDNRFDTLPVIAMTAHALKGDKERGLEAGMDDYITKPIDPQQLFSTLDQWIKTIDISKHQRPKQSPKQGVPVADFEPDITSLELPGISKETGLFRANNKTSLYYKLLKTFEADFVTTEQDIQEVILSEEMDKVKRLAHSIKGVAGNIGASHLSEQAARLELAATESDLDLQSEIWHNFVEELRQVLTGLKQELPKLENNPSQDKYPDDTVVFSPEELNKKLHQLQFALDDDLTLANELLEQLRPSLIPLIGETGVETIVVGIDEFDIDSAASALDKALKMTENGKD